jgi:hypothetical protein
MESHVMQVDFILRAVDVSSGGSCGEEGVVVKQEC